MADGATENELRHVNKSLAGLHRKADKTNGAIGKHAERLIALETLMPSLVTTTACAETRGANWKRGVWLILGALLAIGVGFLKTGGGP